MFRIASDSKTKGFEVPIRPLRTVCMLHVLGRTKRRLKSTVSGITSISIRDNLHAQEAGLGVNLGAFRHLKHAAPLPRFRGIVLLLSCRHCMIIVLLSTVK